MSLRQQRCSTSCTASLPTMADRQQLDILHIIVVGGGPTGVEIMAELYDLFVSC
ncbi:hypothetical protein LIPSTDRAFT_73873 [Lipomyces starkeyi NRRL Y-11557]|uniref:FAD/NAD(P)-binding domain-containing protein n=1 Tax=Lipomyces starkeyi NRRL Y-11557 TaxID=675824 RepID=A0A1E3Q0R8_LIPST|nr:hypothetical protein LIPSTDRAFT_73873 [Lipomyces starkeyi NRRL Y-11557]